MAMAASQVRALLGLCLLAPFAAAYTAKMLAAEAQALSVCAILEDDSLKCWGQGSYSQLGVGSGPRGRVPNQMGDYLPTVDVGTGRTVVAVDIHRFATCAVLDNGDGKCWGNAQDGMAGQPTTVLNAMGITNEVIGDDITAEMGDNLPAIQLGSGRTAQQIVLGTAHACALLDNGAVKCFGLGEYGSLGYGDTDNRGQTVASMGDGLPAVDLGTGITAKKISSGNFHVCAILNDDTVKCFGRNNVAQLGLGDAFNRGDNAGEMGDALPRVDLGTDKTATDLTTGAQHTCVLLNDGFVKCWGYNSDWAGTLGYGDTIQRGDSSNPLSGFTVVDLGGQTAKQIAGGYYHTCAILNDDTAKCWGYNNVGQLGYGDTSVRGAGSGQMGADLPVVDLGAGKTVKDIVTGEGFTCAILNDGSIKCWGDGQRTGHGDEITRGDEANEMGDFLPTIDMGTKPTTTTFTSTSSSSETATYTASTTTTSSKTISSSSSTTSGTRTTTSTVSSSTTATSSTTSTTATTSTSATSTTTSTTATETTTSTKSSSSTTTSTGSTSTTSTSVTQTSTTSGTSTSSSTSSTSSTSSSTSSTSSTSTSTSSTSSTSTSTSSTSSTSTSTSSTSSTSTSTSSTSSTSSSSSSTSSSSSHSTSSSSTSTSSSSSSSSSTGSTTTVTLSSISSTSTTTSRTSTSTSTSRSSTSSTITSLTTETLSSTTITPRDALELAEMMREQQRKEEASQAAAEVDATEEEAVQKLLANFSIDNGTDANLTGVLGQLSQDAATGRLKVVAFLPEAMASNYTVTAFSDSSEEPVSRVEISPEVLAAAGASGPVLLTVTSLSKQVTSKFQDQRVEGQATSLVRSQPVSINLRAPDGTALTVKDLKTPLRIVIKTDIENSSCAFWYEL